MPSKSDAQKQVSQERLSAALRGFAGGLATPPYMSIPATMAMLDSPQKGGVDILDISKDTDTGEYSFPTWLAMMNLPGLLTTHPDVSPEVAPIYQGMRLPTALASAYAEYRKSSPFNKKEDKQLKEVFKDKQSNAIPRKNAFSSTGYTTMPESEALLEFFNKLEESGYEVPALSTIGSSRQRLPKGAAGAYSPNAIINWGAPGKALFFRDKDPSTNIMTHELTHYLDNVASSEVKGYLSEMIQEGGVEATRIGKDFLERMFPEEEGYKGKLGEYSRDVKEVLARIAGEEGMWDMEDRLIGQIRKSVEDITETPSGLIGTPQTKGVHEDVTEIIKDITSYHKASQQAYNLWKNLPFEAQLKSDALSKILSGQEDLSKADKESLQYIETGIPFFKEKGYIWK